MAERVEVFTEEYEKSHLKAPRGRGNWAFCFGRPSEGRYLADLWFWNGTYTDAKRAAVAEAKRLGCSAAFVQP